MTTLFKPTALRRLAIHRPCISMTSVRGKATLPDLPYDYSALEPHISSHIMELHHGKHHQTYVTGFNTASEQMSTAQAKGDVSAALALQPLIKFHGGGHVNHSLFWKNLAPEGKGGGGEPEGELAKRIQQQFSSTSAMISKFNTELASIQGSGWTWLVYDTVEKTLGIRSYANQDAVVGRYKPLLGIDAWEHAYYLDYSNRKAEYFKAVWNVVNWGEVGRRFEEAAAN